MKNTMLPLNEAHLARLQALPLKARAAHYAQLRAKYQNHAPHIRETLEAIITKIETPAFDVALLAPAQGFSPFKIVMSLFILSLKSESASEKGGWLWLVVEPLMNIMVVFILASFLHAPTIFDMPTFPFAVIGVTCWLLFRQSFLALLTVNTRLLNQQDHYHITPALLLFAGCLKPFGVQVFIALLLLFLAVLVDEAPLPHDLLALLLLFIACGLFGLGTGLIGRALSLRFKAAKRFFALALRFLSLVSGLFYVSEQLPQEVSESLLLNPLLHATQLARAAWFESYVSSDASLLYLLAWLFPLLLLGVICLFHTRHRVI
jgi:capsular polysaccharide transport system permease protein